MSIVAAIFPNPTAEDIAAWFLEAIGGPIVAQMLIQRHNDGMSWHEIGDFHGVSHHTAKSWVVAAHVKLRKHGKMPAKWEQGATVA
ncbi:MAG TPA: hypothetical protein VHQ47_08900 [Phycisphaerae bacterium]|jgi:hypothetical protein|nr:hypothetical protein [Phycisphaerae bacterium]